MNIKVAYAKVSGLHCSPRKANLVADLIRGKTVSSAFLLLMNSKKKVAEDFAKLLRSAVANSNTNHGMDVAKLYVDSIEVGKDITLKRVHPRAKGKGNRILKRFCKISIFVAEVY